MGTGEGGTCKARNPEGPDTGLVGGAEYGRPSCSPGSLLWFMLSPTPGAAATDTATFSLHILTTTFPCLVRPMATRGLEGLLPRSQNSGTSTWECPSMWGHKGHPDGAPPT